MIFAPTQKDFSSLLNVLGRLSLILSAFLLGMAIVAAILGEQNPFYDFLITALLGASCGLVFMGVFRQEKELSYASAFLAVALSWLIASLLGALPLYLSGHFASFLDAFFEAMSGFATTGLSLVQDLDHLAVSLNIWRHLMMFLGGQGIIIIAVAFLFKSTTALGFYLGEARDEKILPNIINTSRFIWTVSIVYFILGSSVLFFLGRFAVGLNIKTALIHSVCIFMAAFDTGGFTPQAMNILYYHSWAWEVVTLVLMLLGAFNFNLHYFVWMKKKTEIGKNIETRSFLVSFTFLALLLNFALFNKSYFSFWPLYRNSLYQLVSAHTGCGFSNLPLYSLRQWPQAALLAIILAMGLGGGVCSTTGGIKLMRLGLIFKSLQFEIKRWFYPPSLKISQKYHHLQDFILDEKRMVWVFSIFFLYLISYFVGSLVGVLLGYPFLPALFESVSAAANVGLSVGITTPSMPSLLKIVYIFQMWGGRLEFIAIGVSLLTLSSLLKHRRNEKIY